MKIILFILFFNFLNASYIYDVSLDKEVPIHKSIKHSSTVYNIHDAISNPEKFKEQKYFRRHLQKNQLEKSTWYKIDIKNSSKVDLEKRIFTKWHHTSIDLYIVKDNELIKQEHIKEYRDFKLSRPFFVKADESLDVYLNVNLTKGADTYFYLYIIDSDNLDLISFKDRFFNNGLFLGLLIAMMMYNFFMYFSMSIKSYLYLALYQFSVIFYVSDLRNLFILVFEDYPDFSFLAFKLFASSIMLILSIVFTKEFLSTKENMPIINHILNFFIIMHVIFQFIPSNGVNYSAFLYLTYLVAGVLSFRQGNKFALFFILGFTPTVMFFSFINIAKAFDLNINFEYPSAIQVLAVIEAFSLSMALYFKLKETVQEKEKAKLEALEKDNMMLSQSRFAIMGEMIGNIAHQWRQPLNNISSILVNLSFKNEFGNLDKEFVKEKIEESNKQLQYMSRTIDDFRNFFKSKGEKRYFSAHEVCDESVDLMQAAFSNHQINLKLDIKSDFLFLSHEGELNQVLLIILSNAKDALVLSENSKKRIKVVIDKNLITIEDNAGGIDLRIISKIFDPYFSTKGKTTGTGLGLYIAKVIMEERNKGLLKVENTKKGAKFTLIFPSHE